MLNFLKSLRQDDRGVSALEYAVLAGLVVAGVVIAIKMLDFGKMFELLNEKIFTAIEP